MGRKAFSDPIALSHWRSRALGALRPGVEAALVAAVALGAAQAGWSALTPPSAGAAGAPASDPDQAGATAIATVRTPFAPEVADADAASSAAAALASAVQLAGVRMADDPGRSGAVLMMADGAQRAFVIGQEIGDGVRLSDVQADYVLLDYAGGRRQVTLAAPPRASFALALMGRAAAPNSAPAPALVSAPRPDAPPAPVAVAAEASDVDGVQSPFAPGVDAAAAPVRPRLALADSATPEQAAWLAATLAQVENRDGQPYGWRVASPAPPEAVAAGLQPGDLILTVNGAGPARALEALSAAASGAVTVDVETARGARRTFSLQVPARS